MNQSDFLQQLAQEANLDAGQVDQLGGVFDSNFLAGNGSKDVITGLIAEKLGVDQARADQIYDIAIGIISSGVLDKVKGIFKG